MDKDSINAALSAIGALAEMSLVFYRAALSSGATTQEAKDMLDAYMKTTIYGAPKKEAPEE